jgi:hypothetical protein
MRNQGYLANQGIQHINYDGFVPLATEFFLQGIASWVE